MPARPHSVDHSLGCLSPTTCCQRHKLSAHVSTNSSQVWTAPQARNLARALRPVRAAKSSGCSGSKIQTRNSPGCLTAPNGRQMEGLKLVQKGDWWGRMQNGGGGVSLPLQVGCPAKKRGPAHNTDATRNGHGQECKTGAASSSRKYNCFSGLRDGQSGGASPGRGVPPGRAANANNRGGGPGSRGGEGAQRIWRRRVPARRGKRRVGYQHKNETSL